LAGIERMRERTGFGILVALLQFGILGDELTRRNMEMFAAEVMPHLRGGSRRRNENRTPDKSLPEGGTANYFRISRGEPAGRSRRHRNAPPAGAR
jgi:hypothetical protein